MERSPGLGLACVVVISDLVGVQEREIHRTQKSETALEGGAGFFRDPRVTIIYYFSNPTKSNAAKRRIAALSSFLLVCEWFLYVFVMIFNGFGQFLSIQGTNG